MWNVLPTRYTNKGRDIPSFIKKDMMEKIQQMYPGQYYLIESTASANSVYVETDAIAKILFRYCDYYLKDYLNVRAYSLNKDGWAMLIQIKSAKTIRKHYSIIEGRRQMKKKSQKTDKPKAIWRILSERIRLFISTYVRMSNAVLGREGTLVGKKYSRYKFDSLEKAQAYIAKLKQGKHEMKQSNYKYRGLAEHFRMSGTELTNPLRSSFWVSKYELRERIQEKLGEIFGMECLVLKGLGNLVVPNLKCSKTNANHPQKKPPIP